MTQLGISSYIADSSIMHALYAVSVRRPAILPPASFRHCLTTTPLLLANDLELSFRAVLVVDFHHQINAHAGQTTKSSPAGGLRYESGNMINSAFHRTCDKSFDHVLLEEKEYKHHRYRAYD